MLRHSYPYWYLYCLPAFAAGLAFAGIKFFPHRESIRKKCFLGGLSLLIVGGLLHTILNHPHGTLIAFVSSLVSGFSLGLLAYEFAGILHNTSTKYEYANYNL